MRYFGMYDTNEKSPTYDKILNVARIQEPPKKIVSQRWDKATGKWVDNPDIIFKALGLLDGLEFHEISLAQALQFGVKT